jgi:hypothetical protein
VQNGASLLGPGFRRDDAKPVVVKFKYPLSLV